MWLLAGGLGLLQASGRAGVSSQAATHLATATSHLPALDLQDHLNHTTLELCQLAVSPTLGLCHWISLDVTPTGLILLMRDRKITD